MNSIKNCLKWFSPFVILLILVASCSDENEDTNPVESGFDRSVMLEDMATNLIIPNFETALQRAETLGTAIDNFAQNTTQANLQTARAAWVAAVNDYQHCSAFGFGPGNLALGSFASVIGVFPVDEDEVEENIGNPNFNLNATFSRDIRGFYTVEYLLYGNGQSDAEIVENFTEARKAYLLLVMEEIETTFSTIVSQWTNSYLQEFISNDGTSAGSPVSLLYNEFVKDYESLKNFKLELPAGLTAGQQSPDPTLVEAYYSGISRDLVVEHFENSKNIWYGRSRAGENIIGFKAYLESVEGGSALVAQTETAIADIDAAINALPQGRLSENVGSEEVVTLRNLLQANTANFKSSMSSLLGISITFNSGDGD